MSIKEINDLRNQVAQLTARLDALQSEHDEQASRSDPRLEPSSVSEPSSSVSRRQWVRGAAAAAVGGTAAVVAGARPVAAADGDPLEIGRETNTATSRTRSDYTGANTGVGYLFQSGNTFNSGLATFPAALGGYTTKANQRNGIYGFTNVDDARACGVVGIASGSLSAGVRGRRWFSVRGNEFRHRGQCCHDQLVERWAGAEQRLDHPDRQRPQGQSVRRR